MIFFKRISLSHFSLPCDYFFQKSESSSFLPFYVSFSKWIEFLYLFALPLGFIFKTKESSSYLLPDPVLFLNIFGKNRVSYFFPLLYDFFFFKSINQVLKFCLTMWFFFSKRSNSNLLPYNVIFVQKNRVLCFCLSLLFLAPFFFQQYGPSSYLFPLTVIFFSKVRIEFLLFALSCDFFSKRKKSSSYLLPYSVFFFSFRK